MRRLAQGGTSPLEAAADPEAGHLGGRAGLGAESSSDWLRLLDPPAQIHTPYGATESLPVASIGSDEILGETRHATDQGLGVCVGRPVAGIEARIIQIRDEPIPTWSDDLLVPDGEIGEIVVSGPVVTREYFNRPEATAWPRSPTPRGRRFIIAWATSAIATTRAGSGSAGGSRTG